MKIVFLAREGIASNWIASEIAKQFDFKMLVESGRRARARKFKRYFKKSKVYLWPLRCLDIISALVINRKIGARISKEFGPIALPKKIEIQYCEDVNDDSALDCVRKWRPDLILVYGTAILGKEALSLAPQILNLHGGIVPKYRNVHSEFWALASDEPGEIGVSVLYMTSGIDSGPLVFVERAFVTEGSSVSDAVVANIRAAARAASRVLAQAQFSRLEQIAQSALTGTPNLTGTPGFVDICKVLFSGKPRI